MLQIITIICVTHVQKNFQIQASIKQLLTKYQIFTILPQISHFFKFLKFFYSPVLGAGGGEEAKRSGKNTI